MREVTVLKGKNLTAAHRRTADRAADRTPALAVICLLTIILLTVSLSGCAALPGSQPPVFHGFYQSEIVNGYIVQMTVEQDTNKFTEFIENRTVQQGTFEVDADNELLFHLQGDTLSFDVTLSDDNTFELTVPGVDPDAPVVMKRISETPTYFSTEFDDIDEYRELLN